MSDDYTSLASLQLHYHDLDLLIPEALHAVSADGRLSADQDPKLSAFLQSLQARTPAVDLPVMSMVNNYDAVKNEWCPPEMLQMLANPATRTQLATPLEEYADAEHESGIVVDFESLPKSSMANFQDFVHELSAALHARNLKLMVALPAADWSYDYKYLAFAGGRHHPDELRLPLAHVGAGPDRAAGLVRTKYREHGEARAAGKTGDGHRELRLRLAGEDRRRIPHPVAQAVTFQQGVVTAVESESDVLFDPDTLNPHYSYEDENNQVHNVWMLDGVTAYNELRAAERAGVQGTALWRLGMEDPSIWYIWDATHADDATAQQARGNSAGLRPDSRRRRRYLAHHRNAAERTQRTLEYDADSRQRSTTKASRAIRFPGGSSRWAPRRKKVALTFDDGPDPEWTPKILDILKQKQAPATFFVIGESANQNAAIVKREFAQGNEIGNHTYTHPEFEQISKTQLQLELNLTELLLESTLGVKTTLFRPPYGIDHQPETASEDSDAAHRRSPWVT